MDNVIYFQPRHELTVKQNLEDFIAHCRENLTLYDDQGGWSSNQWKHEQKSRSVAMTFSKYREVSNPASFEPLEEPFLSFAKAYIRYNQSVKAVSSVTNKMVALRVVHDALFEIYDEADILKIDGLVLSKISELTNKRISNDDRRNKIGYQIQILLNFIRDKSFVPTLQIWVNPWPKVGAKAERTDKESRDWQDNRCPSMHQMLALADSFAKAETREDKYWSSIIALLMFAPGRGGELAELTVDCIHRSENGALGIRWYSAKGFGHTVKWVPKDLEATVLEAHTRLVEIGQPAREAAKFAYDNPDIFFRHEECCTPTNFPECKELNAYEFACTMNFLRSTTDNLLYKNIDLKSDEAWDYISQGRIKWILGLRANGSPTYTALARYVLEEYKNSSWPNLQSIERPVWESLVLIRDREFHNQFSTRNFSWRLPSINELNAQLAIRDKLKNPPKTIFQRMGYKEEDGSEIQLTSHQIRVWLSTNAERGGMDAWQLAQWAGRARINDNRHYDLSN